MKDAITYTEISTWLTCRQMHDFSYRRLLLGQGRDTYGAREFGSDIHNWLALFHQGHSREFICKSIMEKYAELYYEKSHVQLLRYWGLALGYIEISKRMTLTEIETVFQVPILHPTEGYPHQHYEYAGKMDGVQLNGHNVLYEIKSTSRFDSMFIDTLQLSWQPQLYMLAMRDHYNVLPIQVLYHVYNTQCQMKIKNGQDSNDLVMEIRDKVISMPEKYRFDLDFAPVIRDTTRQFLWDIACEIYEAYNIYRNAGLSCRNCDFVLECTTGDITDTPTKGEKHEELAI